MIAALILQALVIAYLTFSRQRARRVLRFLYDQRVNGFCSTPRHREHWNAGIARSCSLCDYQKRHANREAQQILKSWYM